MKIDISLLIVIFSCIILALSCHNQENKIIENIDRFTYERYKLKGEIQSFIQYVYNEKDSLIDFTSIKFNQLGQTIETSSNNASEYKRTWSYNEKGEEIESQIFEYGLLPERLYLIDSLSIDGKLIERREYDMHNHLQYKKSYSYNSRGNITISKYVNKYGNYSNHNRYYNEKGILIKVISTSWNKDSIQDRKYIVTFNPNGNITSSISYRKLDEFNRKTIYEYDILDNLIREVDIKSDSISYNESLISYNNNGLKMDSISRYFWSPNPKEEKATLYEEEITKFNENGDIIEILKKEEGKRISLSKFEYNNKGILLKKNIKYKEWETRITYDKFGNEILKQELNEYSLVTNEEKNKIKYDRKQNIKEYKNFINNKLNERIVRKYEYY